MAVSKINLQHECGLTRQSEGVIAWQEFIVSCEHSCCVEVTAAVSCSLPQVPVVSLDMHHHLHLYYKQLQAAINFDTLNT